jgi:hypothetical protein
MHRMMEPQGLILCILSILVRNTVASTVEAKFVRRVPVFLLPAAGTAGAYPLPLDPAPAGIGRHPPNLESGHAPMAQ